jgi:hypothetical protein
MPKSNRQDASRPRMGWGESRIIFCAHSKDIQALISLGWTLKKIHKHLFEADQLLSYGQLSYYQSKETKGRQARTPAVPQEPEKPIKGVPEHSPKPELPKKQWDGGIRSFKKGPSDPHPKDVW